MQGSTSGISGPKSEISLLSDSNEYIIIEKNHVMAVIWI